MYSNAFVDDLIKLADKHKYTRPGLIPALRRMALQEVRQSVIQLFDNAGYSEPVRDPKRSRGGLLKQDREIVLVEE